MLQRQVIRELWRHRERASQLVRAAVRGYRVQTEEEKAEMPTFDYSAKKAATRVYVWGFALYGALGKPQFVKPTKGQRPLFALHKPGRLELKETKVTDVACGYGFTVMAVDDKGEHRVLGTGVNGDSQLGLHQVRRGRPLEFLVSFVPLPIPLRFPHQTKVMEVACGRAHTYVRTDSEGIFGLGNNAYGQCGRPIVPGEVYAGNPTVHKVRNLDDVQVRKIVCGPDHTLFLTDKGEVYSCGWGADGQTGIGHFDNEWTPTKLGGDIAGETIVHVSSAGDCVLAVSERGQLFGWGNSEYKQLVLATDEQQVCVPRHLPLHKEAGKVVEAAAAGTMCAVLDDQGSVSVWGYGILGLGPAVQHSRTPLRIPPTLFGRNEFNPDVRVKHVDCSLNHFVAVTSSGCLYAWGKNNKSNLGLGHRKDQFFPIQVSVPAEVRKISCGIDHSAAICRAFS